MKNSDFLKVWQEYVNNEPPQCYEQHDHCTECKYHEWHEGKGVLQVFNVCTLWEFASNGSERTIDMTRGSCSHFEKADRPPGDGGERQD